LRRTRLLLVVIAAGALIGAAASAQFFGGPSGGGGPNAMADMMERVASGTLEDVNPIRGYLQVGVPMRGSRIVIADEKTTITQMAEVPLSELKVGDEVRVSGVPAAIVAERVQLGPELSMADVIQALQQSSAPTPGAPAPTPPAGGVGPAPPRPPAAPTPPGAASQPSSGEAGPPVSVTVTGKVKSVQPLVIASGSGSEVAVTLPEGARILRRSPADLSTAEPDEPVVAIGQVDADGYLVADRIYLGESLPMGRTGFGRGRGGPGGGPPMMPMGGPGGNAPPAPGGGGGQ